MNVVPPPDENVLGGYTADMNRHGVDDIAAGTMPFVVCLPPLRYRRRRRAMERTIAAKPADRVRATVANTCGRRSSLRRVAAPVTQ